MTTPYFVQPVKHSCSFCNHSFSTKSTNDTYGLENALFVRFQSTNIHTAVQNAAKVKKKKTRRLKKKYAELVEVTESSSNQTKASVSRLKPKDLTQLVKQPDINLGQLYNLKKPNISSVASQESPVLHTQNEAICSSVGSGIRFPNNESDYGNLQSDSVKMSTLKELNILNSSKHEIMRNPELLEVLDGTIDDNELKSKIMVDIDSSLTDAEEDMFPESSLGLEQIKFDDSSIESMSLIMPLTEPVEKGDTHKKTTVKGPTYKIRHTQRQKEELAKVKLTELEKAAREECLFRNLQSYLEVCVSCGFLNRAFFSLMFYHSRSKHSKYTVPANEIKLFNILLQGFAKKGNLAKIRELHQVLHKDNIPPNPQTFAALFECIGRLPADPDNEKLLNQFIDEMTQRQFTFGDVMQNSIFVSDQKEAALNAINRIDPEFRYINPNVPETCYSCSLLKELNFKEDKSFKSPAEDLLNKSELQKLVKEQLKIEISNYVNVKTIEKRTEPNETILYYRGRLEMAQKEWRKAVLETYYRNVKALRAHHHFRSFRHVNIFPYLKVLDPQDYVEIIMQEIRKLAEGSETYSPTTNQLYRELGSQVKSRYEIKYKITTGILDKVEKLYEDYCDWYLDPHDYTNTREKWQHLVYENSDGCDVTMEGKSWPYAVLVAVGRFLYNIIMKDIKIDVNIAKMNSKTPHLLPAFYTLFRTQGRILKEEVKPHPMLARLFRGAAQENLVFEVTTLPMLCPPLPWTYITSGGYLVAKTDLIRLPHQATQQWQILKKTPVQQLYPVFDSLNQLATIPWTVNEPILDVIIEVFNSGGSQRLDVPEPPSACPAPRTVTPEMSKAERYRVYRERMSLRRRKAEMYSLWCDALYRLSLANHFRKQIFWLPHNMDFRGRVYPCPPHLNHLGSDMARSLLCFAKGEPLGPKGLDWLKIHLINLTGLKKGESLDHRLEYAEQLMPEIMDSAENPLSGRMWWARSDEPWQSLACCMTIAEAVKSGDPQNYICHFPVHQDGSCNGLQHYAALGRDKAGGESVNLTPAIKPQDVYSCVAELVERERSKDAALGVKAAQVLEGYVRRKVVKQTVMTTVYGVTRYGARLQIARQLKDIETYPKDFVWQGSNYLMAKTFECLQEMFTSTKEIQDWFTECAQLISQICGQNVEWVTPLGLPVVQPYSRPNKKLFVNAKDHKIKEYYSLDMFERPNVMKQKNAFPPNFIHSLDSSHMMLTSLFCEREGITFVSVHDCFWTHPSTVDIMNKVCRKQFVALHSQPILEDLSEFLSQKYGYSESELANDGSASDMSRLQLNKILRKLPSKGDLKLKRVLDSVYFFS